MMRKLSAREIEAVRDAILQYGLYFIGHVNTVDMYEIEARGDEDWLATCTLHFSDGREELDACYAVVRDEHGEFFVPADF